jgi:hypothetical protein
MHCFRNPTLGIVVNGRSTPMTALGKYRCAMDFRAEQAGRGARWSAGDPEGGDTDDLDAEGFADTEEIADADGVAVPVLAQPAWRAAAAMTVMMQVVLRRYVCTKLLLIVGEYLYRLCLVSTTPNAVMLRRGVRHGVVRQRLLQATVPLA